MYIIQEKLLPRRLTNDCNYRTSETFLFPFFLFYSFPPTSRIIITLDLKKKKKNYTTLYSFKNAIFFFFFYQLYLSYFNPRNSDLVYIPRFFYFYSKHKYLIYYLKRRFFVPPPMQSAQRTVNDPNKTPYAQLISAKYSCITLPKDEKKKGKTKQILL